MSSWRFCPRPKILLLYNHTCANALRTLHRFVLAVFSLQILCSYITENISWTPHATETSVGSQLQFQSDLQITHMYSGEGEEVKLALPVWPTGNVEEWLRDVEKSMKATLRDNIDRSLKVYPEVCNTDPHFDVFKVLSALVSLVCTISEFL